MKENGTKDKIRSWQENPFIGIVIHSSVCALAIVAQIMKWLPFTTTLALIGMGFFISQYWIKRALSITLDKILKETLKHTEEMMKEIEKRFRPL